MITCIISENSAFANELGNALTRVKARFVVRHLTEVNEIEEIHDISAAQIVFLATAELLAKHMEALRRLRACCRARIVVNSAVDDPAKMLEAIRAGADDFLNPRCDLLQELREVMSRLPALSQRETPGRLITILPATNGGDATFLAANLAAATAHRMGGCTLLDLHWRGGDLALYFSMSPRHTLSDLLSQGANLDGEMLKQSLATHDSGVQLLAGSPLFSVHEVDPAMIRRVIDLSREGEPTVIASMPDAMTAIETGALAISDSVVVTTRLDLPSLARTKQHLEYFDELRIPRELVNIVALETGQKAEIPLHEVRRIAPNQRVHGIPEDAMSRMVSVNVGQPMVLGSPKSPASCSVTSLAIELTDASNARTAGDHSSAFSFCRRRPALTAASLLSALIPIGSRG